MQVKVLHLSLYYIEGSDASANMEVHRHTSKNPTRIFHKKSLFCELHRRYFTAVFFANQQQQSPNTYLLARTFCPHLQPSLVLWNAHAQASALQQLLHAGEVGEGSIARPHAEEPSPE